MLYTTNKPPFHLAQEAFMGIFSKKGIFPWFTIIEGVAGYFMQCWLFSAMDDRGLLPRYHIAGIASFLLLALTLLICWLGSRGEKELCSDKLFFPSVPAAAGIALSAIGIALSAFSPVGSGVLGILAPIFGILAAIALGYIAFRRFKGLRTDCIPHFAINLYLVVRTMACCSGWSAEPQFLQYFFPLLACLFLMMTSYYRMALVLGMERSRRYVFCSQTALFCCCVCCRNSDWLFYLSAAMWLTFDCPAPSAVPNGRFLKDE